MTEVSNGRVVVRSYRGALALTLCWCQMQLRLGVRSTGRAAQLLFPTGSSESPG